MSGYPVINYTTFEVEMRAFVNSLQANGYLVNGFATFNTDTDPLMQDEDTVTGESKTLTDEFTVIAKDRLI